MTESARPDPREQWHARVVVTGLPGSRTRDEWIVAGRESELRSTILDRALRYATGSGTAIRLLITGDLGTHCLQANPDGTFTPLPEHR